MERSDRGAVVELELAAWDLDPVPGTSRAETAWIVDRIMAEPGRSLVATEDGRVVGACTPRADSLTVHPDFRRRGHGRRLVAGARELVGRAGLAELQLWGDPDREAPGAFIRALGFTYQSSLWQFRLPAERPVPPPDFPLDVAVRTVQPGQDDARLTELLNRVFETHPSPLSWTEAYIREINSRSDFDPTSVLIMAPRDDPERFIGLCRTVELPADGAQRRGEVMAVGLLPEWRGRNLGRQLLRWGIDRVRASGIGTVDLSVEARNLNALELYRHEGFEAVVEWRHWALPAIPPDA